MARKLTDLIVLNKESIVAIGRAQDVQSICPRCHVDNILL